MNYNETNGIVIGPEFSRLFAEVILQYIDKCVENKLYEKGYKWNVDYECYRYVDDHFFFYNNKEVLEAVRQSYAYHLNEYKMTISNEKTEDIDRPFITPISRAKLAIDKLIHDTITINVDDDLLKRTNLRTMPKTLQRNLPKMKKMSQLTRNVLRKLLPRNIRSISVLHSSVPSSKTS